MSASCAPRLVVIVGPTGVGKTPFALRLAEVLGAEVVCADSRQVYRHLDIGTGKPTAAERAAVPHHVLDVVEPDEPFDSADFARLAAAAIEAVAARGRIPILCGGTGLYVKALLHGLFPGPRAAPALRARLLEEERLAGPGALHRRLAACDPESARRVHPNDLVRLVRAIEVCEVTGRPLSAWQREHGFAAAAYPATLTLGLWREREGLRAAIEARCRAMVAAGLVGEVRGLWERGYGPELRPLRTLGYRHIGAHLRGECALDDALAAMVTDTRRYAKRQLTWFRADPSVRWFHAERDAEVALAAARAFVDA